MTKALVVDENTSYIKELEELTKKHFDQVDVVRIEKFKSEDVDGYDLVVLSGSHGHRYFGNKEFWKEIEDLIQKHPIPILGICFGLRIFGHNYNAEIEMLPEKRKGVMEIRKIKDDPVFLDLNKFSGFKSNTSDNIKVKEAHRWSVKSLDKPLIALAESDDGIEIVRHESKPFYGFQFHPEVLEEDNDGHLLFANAVKELLK